MWDRRIETFIARHELSRSVAQPLQNLVATALVAARGEAPTLAGAPGERTQEGSGAPLPPPDASERFEDLGLLGAGGMGEVRRVRDRWLGRTVAMKVLRPELRGEPRHHARFLREAQVQALLQHPGVVPLHEVGALPDGRPYFTMKEVRGRTFGELIRELHRAARRGAPPDSGWTLRRMIGALCRVCETIAFAHSRGALHRDLKPSNMMIGEFDEVLVLDWGLTRADPSTPCAAVAIPRQAADDATQAGVISGTPAYMAPEQALGDPSRVSKRSDVYALGAVLYELLSDQAPYADREEEDEVMRLLVEPPTPLRTLLARRPGGPAIAGALIDVCERAMAREAADRHADAGALAADLRAWLAGAPGRPRRLPARERRARLRR